MKRIIEVAGLILLFATFAFGICPHARTDLTRFSANGAWNVLNATVVINANQKILLDVSPPKLNSISVYGELVFNDSVINLDVEWIRVSAGGKLWIGSQENGCSIRNKINVTFFGDRTTNQVMGTDPFDEVTLGYKGLAVLTGASVSIVGYVAGPTWTRLSQTALNGTSTITVQDSTGWQVGDRLVIATTDYSATSLLRNFSQTINWQQGRGSPNQNEEREITAVNGKTYTLDLPLRYTHWGAGYEKAEVGLINRRITFRGDESSETSRFGGHIIIRKVELGIVQGVQITRMGQRGILGRYPLHFHLAKEVWYYGYQFKDNSFLRNYQRCIVVHHTSGILLEGNVAFDNIGHCYFLEDGGERGNTFNRNLGIQITPVADDDPTQLIPTDAQPAMFWIVNPNNTFTNNAAVGGRFGFWFSMPSQPTGPSALDFLANDTYVRPRLSPLGGFSNNVAHSCSRNGLHIDDMEMQNLRTELASYSPRLPPYTPTGGNAGVGLAVFSNIIVYKNRIYGVWARGGPFIFDNIISLDNMRGFNSPPAPSVLQNSYIVGETDNIGTPLPAELGRSRPDPYNNAAAIKGWETYDNSGSQTVKDTVFENFTTNAIRKSGVLSALECGPFLIQARNYAKNLTFINANQVWINPCNADCPNNWAMFDVDGSVTGAPQWITSNSSILIDDSCVPHPEWNGYTCPPFGGRYVQVFATIIEAANLTETAYNGTFNAFINFGIPHGTFYPLGGDGSVNFGSRGRFLSGTGSANYQVMANLRPRNGGYFLQWNNIPTPPSITLRMASALPQDWIYIAMSIPQSHFPLNITLWRYSTQFQAFITPVASLSQLLSKYNYYYDTTSEIMYFRMDAIDENIDSRWGFSFINGDDGFLIRIDSECAGQGSGCVKSSKPFAIPARINVDNLEDEFYADLQSCQSGVNPNANNGNAKAMFRLNPTTRTLSYYVIHDHTYKNIQSITLRRGAVRTVGVELATFAFVDNPVSFYTKLTRSMWMSLLKGELYVNIKTASSDESIRGQIGCQGTCSLPTPVSTADPCSSNAYGPNSFAFYTDIINGTRNTNGVYIGTGGIYNTTMSINNTNAGEVLCGNHAITITTWNGNAWVGQTPRVYINTNVHKYLQFYAKLGNGNGLINNIQVFINNGTATIANKPLLPEHIDNYYLDVFSWTRVRIPLDYLNFGLNQSVNYVGFQRVDSGRVTTQTFFIDEIRFITQFTDTTSVGITQAQVYRYGGSLCANSTNPSSTSTNPSSTSTNPSSTSTNPSSTSTNPSSTSMNPSSTSVAQSSTGMENEMSAASILTICNIWITIAIVLYFF